ncbi:hypothetical protein KKE06_04290 [Candidatus Micrarchaeota archaeon]|nr:hypothetical protein [Candidatus Micrarchaeota archaeon]MBU1930320.1 hypothetical protein [Candidatus Micrarchaeota archaeon]
MRLLGKILESGFSAQTRDQILAVLSEEDPLTTKQLYQKISREKGKPISYQAVHKALKQLETDCIVKRFNSKYQLHPKWILELEGFVEKIKAKEKEKPEELRKPEVRTLNSVIELGRFLIFELMEYPALKKPSIWIWTRMYSLMGLSKDEVEGVRQFFKKNSVLILSESNTLIDQFLAETFEKMRTKVKLGVPHEEPFDTFLIGNHLCEIYFEPEHHKAWKKLWEKPKTIKEFDLEKTLEVMHHPYKSKAIIYYDKEKAQKIRKNALKYFPKKPKGIK